MTNKKVYNQKETAYHTGQFDDPYRSTEFFYEWLKRLGAFKRSKTILDVGSGAGANIAFFAKKHPQINFLGIDKNRTMISLGNKILRERNLYNAALEYGDIYNIKACDYNAVDGVVSLQVLSWLEHYDQALESILQVNPNWFAATSLFYEGEIDAFITLRNYYRPIGKERYSQSFYNVYSLPRLKEFLARHGYKKFMYKKFVIDIDLKQNSLDIGTYTQKLAQGERLQFTGPLWQPWYFIYVEK